MKLSNADKIHAKQLLKLTFKVYLLMDTREFLNVVYCFMSALYIQVTKEDTK